MRLGIIGWSLIGCLLPTLAWGSVGIGGSIGAGTREIKAWRINIQRTWSERVLTKNQRRIFGYGELAFTRLNNNTVYDYPTNHNVEAYSASVAMRFSGKFVVPVFLDVALGVAYFSKQSIATRNLGTNFLFEDRLGVGITLGKRQKFELGYRFIHYSNAYLAQKNQGLNLQFFSVGYWFG